MIKPRYVFYYKNQIAPDFLLNQIPFNQEPVKIKKCYGELHYEYEHFTLTCFQTFGYMAKFKGYRWWTVIIEEELYNDIKNDKSLKDYIQDILEPSINLFELVGGQIVRIEIPTTI
jgi:hypothetical protein